VVAAVAVAVVVAAVAVVAAVVTTAVVAVAEEVERQTTHAHWPMQGPLPRLLCFAVRSSNESQRPRTETS